MTTTMARDQHRPGGEPYPPEPASAEAHRQKFECQVCGATFVVLDYADGADEIPDARRFLHRHRRCLQRVLERGGTLARPAYRRD